MSNPELKSIIYAEDEADIRSIAEISLEDMGGFTVKYCMNGLELLEMIKTFKPDLLLLDVMMPGMDGPTALRTLRENPEYKDIPAIFMTAKIQAEEIAEYNSLGAIEVISKPFDPMTLADQIKGAWDKYHG